MGWNCYSCLVWFNCFLELTEIFMAFFVVGLSLLQMHTVSHISTDHKLRCWFLHQYSLFSYYHHLMKYSILVSFSITIALTCHESIYLFRSYSYSLVSNTNHQCKSLYLTKWNPIVDMKRHTEFIAINSNLSPNSVKLLASSYTWA